MLGSWSSGSTAAEAPVISADAGPCSPDLTVTDNEGKPLYNAKIQVTVRSGFMNKRKTTLEIGTDADGKARVEGLPARPKKPLEFAVRSEQLTKSCLHDPASECNATLKVALGAE